MKSIFKISFVCFSILLIYSCSSELSNPKKAAEKYVKYCMDGDVDSAADFLLKIDESKNFTGSEFEEALDEYLKTLPESKVLKLGKTSKKAIKKLQKMLSDEIDDADENDEVNLFGDDADEDDNDNSLF